jgi:signal transduction histidine kinase
VTEVNEVDAEALFRRYQELQRYVGWTEEDAQLMRKLGPLVSVAFGELVEDFYTEIDRHPEARRVITGGAAQIERLKGTLQRWLAELFSGVYDREYVVRRWRVGWRHVEIGLNQVYTNVALSRLRGGLLRAIETRWTGELSEALRVRRSLNLLLDLDLAIIEDAYQSEYSIRQQRAERLIAIGQMAGGVAHELRNPLNVVKTSVYYLLNARHSTPEKTAEHLRRIERQVGLADKVITALSDFAKLPFPELRTVDVPQSIREALEASPLPPNITVQTDCEPTLPAMLGDPDQLRIVLGNLIRNARDAMPQGGAVSIRGTHQDGQVEIAISDTGVGIPEENIRRIMEPLYSTKARGLGLGLAITRAIIEKHGGQLRVVSQPGQGSTFTVRLPAANSGSVV